jgi:hypothetical protein
MMVMVMLMMTNASRSLRGVAAAAVGQRSGSRGSEAEGSEQTPRKWSHDTNTTPHHVTAHHITSRHINQVNAAKDFHTGNSYS